MKRSIFWLSMAIGLTATISMPITEMEQVRIMPSEEVLQKRLGYLKAFDEEVEFFAQHAESERTVYDIMLSWFNAVNLYAQHLSEAGVFERLINDIVTQLRGKTKAVLNAFFADYPDIILEINAQGIR